VVRKHRGAIGLTVARRDRFVSLDAAEDGWSLTKSFRLPDGSLHVNAETTATGECRVELCDADSGRVLAISKPIVGDKLDSAIQWEQDKPAIPPEQSVRLRFRLRQAKLFSYWFAVK
jgi:hypothetical protein